MENMMNKPKLLTIGSMIIAAAIIRLIPHPPNFTPIFAMALFGGAYLDNKKTAFLLPLASMLVSDVFFGLHSLIPVVYGTIALITAFGFLLQNRVRPSTVIGASLLGSLFFFIVTNFAVWAMFDSYPHTVAGLGTSYVVGLPYLKNSVISGLFYSALMFGSFELAKRKFPVLADKNSEITVM